MKADPFIVDKINRFIHETDQKLLFGPSLKPKRILLGPKEFGSLIEAYTNLLAPRGVISLYGPPSTLYFKNIPVGLKTLPGVDLEFDTEWARMIWAKLFQLSKGTL